MNPILWEFPDEHSVEYFHFGPTAESSGFVLEGTVILLLDGLPARIFYHMICNERWQTSYVHILQSRQDDFKLLELRVDKDQIWRSKDIEIPDTRGIFDVDIQVTPATNTLPIRRLALRVGESREVDALWIVFPEMRLQRLQQVYTRISDRRYLYENPATGFQAELEVDEDGFVVRYGDFWRRVT